ncbi:MAG: hypothetical protein WAR79_14155 [Melioribacteraceae bacterium]
MPLLYNIPQKNIDLVVVGFNPSLNINRYSKYFNKEINKLPLKKFHLFEEYEENRNEKLIELETQLILEYPYFKKPSEISKAINLNNFFTLIFIKLEKQTKKKLKP